MFEWLFGTAPIKEGIISKMWHEEATPAKLISIVPVPIYSDPTPEQWMIEFRQVNTSRKVPVSKDCCI